MPTLMPTPEVAPYAGPMPVDVMLAAAVVVIVLLAAFCWWLVGKLADARRHQDSTPGVMEVGRPDQGTGRPTGHPIRPATPSGPPPRGELVWSDGTQATRPPADLRYAPGRVAVPVRHGTTTGGGVHGPCRDAYQRGDRGWVCAFCTPKLYGLGVPS